MSRPTGDVDRTDSSSASETSGYRPLVTFLLCAFNQELYVREAVESAFAQTYDPLEIILSDDASSDRTAAIMQEMAEQYSGPHEVRFVQNPQNLGVVGHVLRRAREARGEIVVMAAGDDVSAPERTATMVTAFDENVAAVFSKLSLIDRTGMVLVATAERAITGTAHQSFIRNTKVSQIQGSSSAYRKWVFDIPLNGSVRKYHEEDLLFSFYLGLLGAEVRRLEETLVKYRVHDHALTNLVRSDVEAGERWTHQNAGAAYQRFTDFEELTRISGRIDVVDMVQLGAVKVYLEELALWPDLTSAQRLKRVLRIHHGKSMGRQIKWKLARLWGSFPFYQPKRFLSRFQTRHKTRQFNHIGEG